MMTNATPEVRTFVPEDWDAVCNVYESAAKWELTLSGTDPRAFRPMAEEEDLDEFLQLNTAMVASVRGQIVGFVAWRDRGEWIGSGYLSWLYVDPAYHRRGIGDSLMRRAMKALGAQAWTLTKTGNDPAINLNTKHGMRAVTTRPADTWGYPHTEVRLALPTSRRSAPDVPNFGG